MEEIWKDIEGYEGLYQISTLGRVRSLRKFDELNNIFVMKPNASNRYYKISLSKNGKTKYFFVHRLVAQAFIPNPDNLSLVNHKDCNKLNNCVSNLEWCDYKYNNNYANINAKRSIGKAITQLKNSNRIDIINKLKDIQKSL